MIRCQGNGLLRLNDILTWSTVATTAGSNPVILSFQRGYLPLLRVIYLSLLPRRSDEP